jgi:hypothetical protein
MNELRGKVLPARNKLGAHADRAVILKGEPLGAASWKEWEEFWAALANFIRILNEKKNGKPFEIDAGGVQGDAEMLLKALHNSRHFETLLDESDSAFEMRASSWRFRHRPRRAEALVVRTAAVRLRARPTERCGGVGRTSPAVPASRGGPG